MATTQKLLGEAVGIQFTGTRDETGTNPILGLTDGLIVGRFRRGRTDKPMRITQQNIRAELGYQPNNKFYQAVQNALDQFPFVWVLRVGGGGVEPSQPIGCDGAIDRILVGAITDGGLISVYVDDVLVGDEGNFMFRLDGIAPALADFDIEVTPYDESGNEITVENVPGRYYSVERALFKNLSGVYKKIRIETVDADSVNTNYTPENATFDYDSTTASTTFCLAPAV